MGRSSRNHKIPRSQTLPSSPTHSSSSSDFEFTVGLSPRKSTTTLIPADELFYKGQLLPLHLSPRLSMVRTLLLASSSSSSSSDTTTTASRDSTGSSSDFPDSRDSSRRPSSATDDDNNHHNHNNNHQTFTTRLLNTNTNTTTNNKKAKYFSLSRFSSVFRKDPKVLTTTSSIVVTNYENLVPASSVRRVSSTAKDVIRKYLKKVKPLYEKLSQKQCSSTSTSRMTVSKEISNAGTSKDHGNVSHSFSGNLRYPRRRSCISSCPSSMRSSPNHSGVLSRTGVTLMSKQFAGGGGSGGGASTSSYSSETSSMEELQSAIQGAIAHCKSSMNIPGDNKSSNGASSSNSTLMVSNGI